MTETGYSTNLKFNKSCNDWLSAMLTADSYDSPPWKSPRTVIDFTSRCDPSCNDESGAACVVHPAYYALKNRLTPVAIRSRHARQRLYLDSKTGQHWLSLRVSIRRREENRELLKPISQDLANSLRSPSRS